MITLQNLKIHKQISYRKSIYLIIKFKILILILIFNCNIIERYL